MPKRSPNEVLLNIVFDLFLTEVALWLSQVIRLNVPLGQDLPAGLIDLPVPIYLLVAVLWLALFSRLSLYQIWRRSLSTEILHVVFAVGLAAMTLAGVLYLSFRDVSRLQFFYFCALDLVLLVGVRIGLDFICGTRFGRRSTRRILILGAGKTGQNLASRILRERRLGAEVIGFLDDAPASSLGSGTPLLGRLDDVMRCVINEQITEVIFALPSQAHERLTELVVELRSFPVLISVVPDVLDISFPRTRVENTYGMPLVRLRDSSIEGGARIIKRLFDVIVSSLLLILLCPLLLLIAVLIRLDSAGPVILRQERIGENARPFKVFKFRSMVNNAEARLPEVVRQTNDGAIDYKRRDDPRVTRVGRFLRRFSLDELPQFWNVLRGEMSVVGPRPEMPWLVERYELWQWQRFAVPPGLTGWWQINGRSDRPMHLNVDDDLYYIQNYSFWLDWQILLKTVVVILKGQGAY
jgi:exopolysaccharide biosynthesis polyprenyl glycosylphosphotransferase